MFTEAENPWFRVKPLSALSVPCPVGGDDGQLRRKDLDLATIVDSSDPRSRGGEGLSQGADHPTHHHLELLGEVAAGQEDETEGMRCVGVQVRAREDGL